MKVSPLEEARLQAISSLNYLAENALGNGDYDQAMGLLQQALDLDPKNALLCNNLAFAYHKKQLDAEALWYLVHGLGLKEDVYQLHCTLGLIYTNAGYTRGAIQAFERCLELAPDCYPAHVQLACRYFEQQEWDKGWPHYEWRFGFYEGLQEFRDRFEQPHWDGTDPAGKRIVLYCELGLGDFIQYIRYAEDLKRRKAYVIVEAPKELAELFRCYWPIGEVVVRPDDVSEKSKLPAHDAVISVASLPLYTMDTTAGRSYLDVALPDPFSWPSYHKRISITWAGANYHPRNELRSFDFNLLQPLADLSADFYGIHNGFLQTDLFGGWNGKDESFDSFYETARFLKTIDLVITVDTAVVHVAGALGLPTWLLLGTKQDVRWPLPSRGDRTNWYSSVRIFRQEKAGDWQGVIARVKAALQEWLREDENAAGPDKSELREVGSVSHVD